MPSIQQQRAAFALSQIKNSLSESVNQKEYLAYSSSFAPMVHQNGLLQAASFYRRKGGTHERLYKSLQIWLVNELNIFSVDTPELIENLSSCTISEYRTAQAESQALLLWFKQFAKAYMLDEESSDEKEGSS